MKKTKNQSKGFKRISVTIYDAQLREIDQICRERGKTRRVAFFEAFQNYIASNQKGGSDE